MGSGFGSFRRVILFGADGAGTFFEQANTPCLDTMFKDGAFCRRMLVELPSASAENWGSMLHGVDRQTHGLTNWTAGVQEFPADSPYPSVFRAIREAMPEAKMASFTGWPHINRGIVENGLGVYKYSDGDCGLVHPACRYIRENDFTFMFLQFDSTDGTGHGFGYGSDEHLAAITTVSMFIYWIVLQIEQCGMLEDTLILVTADHGGTPWNGRGGDHGGDSDAEKYVRFMAAGKGIGRGELTDMRIVDVPSVVLHALGVKQPVSWTGRVPGGLFADVPESLVRPAGLAQPVRRIDHPRKAETGRFLEAFADMSPKLYLPFDNNAPTLASGLEQHGKLYRIPGAVGEGMRFDDGWLSMDCPDLTDGLFLIMWIRLDSVEKTVEVCSTRTAGGASGFRLRRSGRYLLLELPDSEGRTEEALLALADNPVGEWMHFIICVDQKAHCLRVFLNFVESEIWNFPEKRRFLLSGERLTIARDGAQAHFAGLPATLDDFCLLGRAPSDEEIGRIRAYYMA